jgi:hypothetical protein
VSGRDRPLGLVPSIRLRGGGFFLLLLLLCVGLVWAGFFLFSLVLRFMYIPPCCVLQLYDMGLTCVDFSAWEGQQLAVDGFCADLDRTGMHKFFSFFIIKCSKTH